MITIAIELNHVVRNVNRQILKYFSKDIEPIENLDDVDETDDVNKYIHFNSKKEKWSFEYEDYPYEIFGCAKTMDKNLSQNITKWLADIEDIEDDKINIIFYSLNEDNLTIQSSYFFLSKIGTRVRKVVFPSSLNDLWSEADVFVSANPDVIGSVPNNKKAVVINRTLNNDINKEGLLNYDSLTSIIEDKDFFKKLK